MNRNEVPDKWKWFVDGKFGLFIHFGPYAQIGRGEQVMFREHMDPCAYQEMACNWNPTFFDARQWAAVAKQMGVRYACLTTRHHDGYCLWDSKYTDYTSMKQAPKRDFVKEFVDEFRKVGIRIGLYYSWLDWRLPAYFEGPQKNPDEFELVRTYIHNQVIELLTNYGKIDYFFFDGVWPRNAKELKSLELLEKMRELQPDIIVNNRLDSTIDYTIPNADGGNGAGESEELGDFGTPERQITPDKNRLWESCQVSTWRLWGYASGERWRSSAELLDGLCECAEKGGNFILNVGPQADGRFPVEFVERANDIGQWLSVHGECIYGAEEGNVTEFVTYGRQTLKGNILYLILRFWDCSGVVRLADLCTKVKNVKLLTTGQALPFDQKDNELYIMGLPKERPTKLFPVIRIECDGIPTANQWGRERLWEGDPQRVADWAIKRGRGTYMSGNFN